MALASPSFRKKEKSVEGDKTLLRFKSLTIGGKAGLDEKKESRKRLYRPGVSRTNAEVVRKKRH